MAIQITTPNNLFIGWNGHQFHTTAESQRAPRKALLVWVQAAMMSSTQTQAKEPKALNKGSRWDIFGRIKVGGVMGDLENESCAADLPLCRPMRLVLTKLWTNLVPFAKF